MLPQIAQLLVAQLQQQSTFLNAGPFIVDSASPIRVPRVAATITAAFVAPGVQIADSSVDFDEVTLLSPELKALKVRTKVSSELIRQSVIGLDAVLRQRVIADTAATLDAALCDGAGTSNTIKGILRATGIKPIGAQSIKP